MGDMFIQNNFRTIRKSIKQAITLVGLGIILISVLSCSKSNPPTNTGGQAIMKFVDMEGNAILSGQVTTDVATYSIVDGQASVEWSTVDTAVIVIPGFIQRGTFVENKTYIMVPNEWNAFFTDVSIAGIEGTSKFASTIKARINGPTSDDDYQRAKNALEDVMNKLGASFTWVDSGENFKITINEPIDRHGETVNNGIITYTNVYLIDNFDVITAHHEITSGTMHVDEPNSRISAPETTAIADESLITDADKKIYNVFYNRNRSIFTMGSEQENR